MTSPPGLLFVPHPLTDYPFPMSSSSVVSFCSPFNPHHSSFYLLPKDSGSFASQSPDQFIGHQDTPWIPTQPANFPRICEISEVLKITVVPKKVTCSFMLSSITTLK